MKTVHLLSCFWIISNDKAIELQLFTVSSSYIRHHYPSCMTERKKNKALFYMKNKYQIKRENKERQLQRFIKPKVDVSIVLKYM